MLMWTEQVSKILNTFELWPTQNFFFLKNPKFSATIYKHRSDPKLGFLDSLERLDNLAIP